MTGAASGIGLATAEALVKSGAKVLGLDIGAQPTISSESFHFMQVNLTEVDAAEKIVKACVEAFGEKIDALLNVAGIADQNNSVDSLEDEAWDRIIAVNLTAPVKLMRAVVPIMLKGGGGSIVNVASKAALSGATAGVAYTASKHGIVSVDLVGAARMTVLMLYRLELPRMWHGDTSMRESDAMRFVLEVCQL